MSKIQKPKYIQIVVALLLFGLWTDIAIGCHADPPIYLTQNTGDGSSLAVGGTLTGTSVRLRGYSSGGTCGCGPYYLEFEVIPTSQGYSGNPNYTSPADNRQSCTQIPYGWTNINNLTPGVSYKWRVREYTSGSGARSGWVEYANPAFTVAGFSNSAPTASAQSVTGNEDSPQTITLAGSDADGDALTYALATNSSNGTSTLSGNVLTYTPNTNYNGSDSFTFTVSDGEYTSSAATVNISITAVNDAPTATVQSVTGNEDAAQTITLTGSDAEGDALTYALATNPSNGTVSLQSSAISGLVEGGSSCNQGGWGGNYVGINLAFYNANQSLFASGTQITFGSYIYYIDAMNIPGNCNSGVALVYIVTDQSACDGNPWTWQQNYSWPFIATGTTWTINNS